ncbi:hypothetical protein BZG02_07300 [Labilibaculum filiforme]|uniref:PAAR motif protein n=1 Tax=Labilibaculum filiforme TaxID=1940526 RepID=A0A2N3I0R7_9BACT|nr:PAAR domain-containing protein [Labilibaculum filiforme]PKQ63823.1 hypothetical protein BZG02_07300 [Labilibaculum filiforme]
MAGKPIATVGSMHVCPMCSGLVPHVGGPIAGPGAPNVLINGKPAALMGDMCVCVGPPDVVAQGNPSVLINGVPVVCQGDMTAHGGIVMSGEANILISTSTPNPQVTSPIQEIPFPEIRITDRLGAALRGRSADLRESATNMAQVRSEAENDTLSLTNLQWKHEGIVINKAIVDTTIELTADVSGAENGEIVRLAICERTNEDKEIKSVSAKVENQQIVASWKVAYKLNERNQTNEDEEESSDYIEPKIIFKGCTTNTSSSESNEISIYTWLKTRLKVESTGEILCNTNCVLHHPTGIEENLTSDDNGYVLVEELKLGKYKITI